MSSYRGSGTDTYIPPNSVVHRTSHSSKSPSGPGYPSRRYSSSRGALGRSDRNERPSLSSRLDLPDRRPSTTHAAFKEHSSRDSYRPNGDRKPNSHVYRPSPARFHRAHLLHDDRRSPRSPHGRDIPRRLFSSPPSSNSFVKQSSSSPPIGDTSASSIESLSNKPVDTSKGVQFPLKNQNDVFTAICEEMRSEEISRVYQNQSQHDDRHMNERGSYATGEGKSAAGIPLRSRLSGSHTDNQSHASKVIFPERVKTPDLLDRMKTMPELAVVTFPPDSSTDHRILIKKETPFTRSSFPAKTAASQGVNSSHGRHLPMEEAEITPLDEPSMEEEDATPQRVIVDNLLSGTSAEDVATVFEPFGRIHWAACLPKEDAEGDSACIMLEFSTNSEALVAIQEMNGIVADGRKLVVRLVEDINSG